MEMETNFLDDNLFNCFVENKNEDLALATNKLFKICDQYYVDRVYVGLSYKDFSLMVDKVGRFWDFFIKKIEKSDVLTDEEKKSSHFYKSCNYVKFLLKNEQINEMYLKGKKQK